MKKILVMNPGGSSTKIAVYEDKKENMGLPAFSSLYIYAGTSGNGF